MENYSSYIELDRSALYHNFKFIRNQIQENVVISSVVKANAYGHGIREMVPLLESEGQHHFSVFSAFEARLVHQAMQSKGTIMIMGDIPSHDQKWVIQKGIEFFAFSFSQIKALLWEAQVLDKKLKLHLELETGMHRHGIEEGELDEFLEILQRNKEFVQIKGVCTHFAGSENEANNTRIQYQQEVFERGVNRIRCAGFNPEYRHVSCSAAVLNFKEWNLDLVRVGILQYGLWPSQECRVRYERNFNSVELLKPVLSWKTFILEIKTVPAGEYVGYGTTFLAEKEMTIASFPVGYGYGYTRQLSNLGKVLIKGQYARIVGNINMNMTLIDITGLEAQIGDPVILIGKEGDHEIRPHYFGNDSTPLNYELLARLDKTIPRRVK